VIVIPKKVTDRFIKEVGRFQTILKSAKDRDINESDTVTIIKDILAQVFGFDKYTDITSEYCIRNTYCDLAVKTDGNLKYLIEVKAIGLDLKNHHLQQAINYGANQGVNWIVLTNGITWEIHRMRFEKPIATDRVCCFDFLAINTRKKDDQEKLYLLSKEGLNKSVIEDFHERSQTVNKFTIAALIQHSSMVDTIRKELKKLSPGLHVESPEVENIIKNEVLKREVIEGDLAQKASTKVKKSAAKAIKKVQPSVTPAIKSGGIEG
jgi:predicted type IV restriction endonuclease